VALDKQAVAKIGERAVEVLEYEYKKCEGALK